MKEVSILTRELTIYYTIDQLSADEISNKLNETYNINSTGDEVAELLRERGVAKRVRRTSSNPIKNYTFTNPETTTTGSSKGYVNMNSKVELEEVNN